MPSDKLTRGQETIVYLDRDDIGSWCECRDVDFSFIISIVSCVSSVPNNVASASSSESEEDMEWY